MFRHSILLWCIWCRSLNKHAKISGQCLEIIYTIFFSAIYTPGFYSESPLGLHKSYELHNALEGIALVLKCVGPSDLHCTVHKNESINVLVVTNRLNLDHVGMYLIKDA